MKNILHVRMEIVSTVLLLLIPWYGPIPTRPPCPREKASLVRKVVSKKLVPILEKVGATLPLECPLHPARDIFTFHDSRKKHYSPQWTCGFCGKSFYHEAHLDAHMELKHPDKLNNGEDTICLAEFCDVMRCEVLHERLQELEELTPTATALDIWHKPMLVASKRANYHGDKAIEQVLPRSLMRTTPKSSWNKEQNKDTSDNRNTEEQPEIPFQTLHSWRDTCNEEHLAVIRVKCQQLIQQCISGLVLNLTLDQVRDVEGAFNRAVCWYLTCERYWEAGTMDPPEFPWGIVISFILLFTLGVSACYYIVWVLCESANDSTVNSPVTQDYPSGPLIVSGGNGSCSSRGNSSRYPPGATNTGASTARARFCASESESECRDSGFNEGALYPEYESQDVPGSSSTTDPQGGLYRSRHYSEDSRYSLPVEEVNPRYYVHEERLYNYASTFTPNYEQRRLRRNRYNYLDDFDAYSEMEGETLDPANGDLSRERSDSFIYVSYPPEVKKRFQENR